MKLSATQVRRLRNGELSTLEFAFPFDPSDPARGRPAECCVILEWEPERRLWDRESEQLVTVPRQKLMWLEVTAVNRHRKGHWLVQFSVTDNRHKPLYLGPQGSYTTSRFRAIDELEVVPCKAQDRYAKDANETWEPIRLERAAARQQERWRRKRQSKQVARALRPAA